MIRVEHLEGSTYAVVDYITGKREIRITGPSWFCLSFVVGMVSPTNLAQA